jgi:uncharacterized membrane protein YdfJ with MMPL/SSD domain
MLTGQAMATDLSDRLIHRLPIFIAAVVAMSFVLLMIVFRSVLVPLKAVNVIDVQRPWRTAASASRFSSEIRERARLSGFVYAPSRRARRSG